MLARARRPAALTVALWAGLLAVTAVWGARVGEGRPWHVDAPPFVGRWELAATWWLLAPAAVGLLWVLVASTVVTLEWRSLLVVAGLAAAVWSLSLARVDGPEGHLGSLGTPHDYLPVAEEVDDPLRFVDGFVDELPGYTVHVRGHPPGMVLVLWIFGRLGAGGTAGATVLVLAGAGVAVAAVLLAAREVAGEAVARSAAPFVAVAPAGLWATNADAFYSGVGATAVALVVLATSRRGRRADILAVVGGLAFGATLLLSYGLVLLGLPMAVVAAARRRPRPLLVAAAGTWLVLGGFALAGFWWVEGLLATRVEYVQSVAGARPYWFWVVANLAVFAVALGPATAVALTRLRHKGLWLLVGGALLAVAVADLSGMSKAEVERIWQPFVPWVLLSGAAIGTAPALGARAWLLAQVGTGLALVTWLRSPF
jgi:methylthioxylose transferase